MKHSPFSKPSFWACLVVWVGFSRRRSGQSLLMKKRLSTSSTASFLQYLQPHFQVPISTTQGIHKYVPSVILFKSLTYRSKYILPTIPSPPLTAASKLLAAFRSLFAFLAAFDTRPDESSGDICGRMPYRRGRSCLRA